ncbi:hypothetical protein HOU00_gp354 [Caulobacter phage CcrPW]|uniref:Uncharacterized protein n=1 Tax=Caulobacter phage CcrPW TaxID=2283271 RepID=A0A385EA55_9CAUD|nr:hypothetical protein HOU00_gp354 [Caulobacter phage CcrPW]AXQ68771.1 hypothetical protein CcrPW_gp232 [Caulobacter phage CcrPW]
MFPPEFLDRPWTFQRFVIILGGGIGGLIAALYVHGIL